jgi:serine/threonine-protein phosphatase 4 regulatory subunit 4
MDIFSVEGEVPGKENMNALNASLQHEERVQRHIESGNLAPHEVALYILANGSTGQKVSMLQHLGRTIKECEERKTTQIITELNAAMWTQDLELQVAAPAALETVLGQLSETQVVLLLGGARTMLEVKSDQVRRAWSALVLGMVPFLTCDVLVRDLVPLALKKGEHSEPHDQRVFGCQLIGRLCRKLDGDAIVQKVLNKAIALCQDTETSVRVAMCGQLGEVARAIGLERTKERITAELFELLVDEEKLVSRAAFTSLIDLVEFFDPPYRREHFYPIIKSYITSPPEEVLSLLVDEFGRFLWKIKSDIQGAEDVTLFANFFRQSAQKPDPEVRRLCAFNLPAVVASLPLTVYPTHLTQLQRALAVDTHPPTRRAIAAGMHELCTLLGDKAASFLKDSYFALLQDTNLSVRTVAVGHLSEILDTFAAQLKGDERESFFQAIVPHISSYEAAVHRDWRKVAKLLDSFGSFPRYFSAQLIHDRWMPLLMTHLLAGATALKEQCAHLVVQFSKVLGSNLLIVEAFSRIIADFGRSTSCFNRMTFCLLFKSCATAYSRRFLRDRLLQPLLDLAKDPVPNVRIQLVKVLPTVRRTLKAPVEAEHATHFNGAMQRLKQDADPEVQATLLSIAGEMDEIETTFARQAAMRVTNAPDDVRDRELEQVEGDLLEVAKEQEKIERRQKLREMLRSEAVITDPGSGRAPPGKGPRPGARPGYGAPAPSAKPSSTTRPAGTTNRTSSSTRLPGATRR